MDLPRGRVGRQGPLAVSPDPVDVDLVPRRGLKPAIRDQVLEEARELFAA